MNTWPAKEKSLLAQIWATESKIEILRLIPRTWKAIRRQADRLKLKRFRAPYGDKFKKIQPPSNIGNIAIPSWLVGEMLSDGHVDVHGRYCHTTKYKEYAQFLECKFNELEVPTKIYPNQYFDKHTKKTYSRFMLRTRSCFKNLRTTWYQPYKIVPNEIQVNNEILHHWIMGDGYIRETGFVLCTMSFDAESLQTLRIALLKHGLSSTTQKPGNIYIRRTPDNKNRISDLLSKKLDWTCYNYKQERLLRWAKST